MKTANSMPGVLLAGFLLIAAAADAQTPLYFGWSAVTPYAADFDGDGCGELGLYDATQGAMYVRKLCGDELAFGDTIAMPGFIAACADFDGDRKADPASYDLTSGFLYAFLSEFNYQLDELPCAVGVATTEAKPADFDGDGKADPALYDSASGAWIIYPSASGYQPVSFILGGNSTTAVPMDYDGDAKADPCVYDQTTGLWMALCSASQYTPTWVVYGGPGCVAAPADFDGDGKADPTIYCAALGVWGTLNSASNYAPNIIIQGGPNCTPIPGNYYFTNQADYALYNTTNGCWYIDYNQQVDSLAMGRACKWLLKNLFKGSVGGIVSGSVGWGLRVAFGHGEDPSDPHWAEQRQMLSEMNQKLDELLYGQQVITNMLVQLSQQLEYSKTEIEWFISQSAANNAISIIESHYDQHGIDGYRSFYECDTNNPPSCADIDTFVNIVLGSTYNIKTAVDNIYRAIIPATGNTNGVLRMWATMVKPKITPDNLLDNYMALAYYYATMYNYQMKGAAMYVDASRVHGTSVWAQAATATWVTNDLMQMVQAEVDEFRSLTYDYIMTAVNAAHNPASTNATIAVTNVSEVLSAMEFFSRQWLGQTESLCATFLAVDPPGNTYWPAGITAVDASSGVHVVQAVITNWNKGRAYGYLPGNQFPLVVDDNYAFIRYDFGQQACGTYTFKKGQETLGAVSVSNYDENMNLINDPAITNWFGHFYAPPVVQRWTLPLNDPAWGGASFFTDTIYMPGAGPYDRAYQWNWIRYSSTWDPWPMNLTNYSMRVEAKYILGSDRSDARMPDKFGVNPYTFAPGYPISVSNATGRAISIRAYIAIGNSSAWTTKNDTFRSRSSHPGQYWQWNINGFAQFNRSAAHTAKWATWSESKYHQSKDTDFFSRNWPYCETQTYVTVPEPNATITLYVGGSICLIQDIYKGGKSYENSYGRAGFQCNIQRIQVSFY